MKKRILISVWLLVGTVAFAYWWDNALISIPLSEKVWTFYFHLTGQTNPGTASDLEFITVLVIGFFLSYAVARLFLFRKKK